MQSSCCASCADVRSIGISFMTQGSHLSQRSVCVCPMHICSSTYSNEACTVHQPFVFSSLQCKCHFAIAILSVHSLIDWISDTRSQGCTDLQSLVKCLDHRGIVLALDTVYVHVCSQTHLSVHCGLLNCNFVSCAPKM